MPSDGPPAPLPLPIAAGADTPAAFSTERDATATAAPDLSMFGGGYGDADGEDLGAGPGADSSEDPGAFLADPYGDFGAVAATIPLDPYLADCVAVDEAALTQEFSRIPSDFARWNELYARAVDEYLEAKAAVPRVRSRRAIDLRKTLKAREKVKGDVKFSEALLADWVNVDADVIAAQDRLRRATVTQTRIRGILTALAHKSQSLVSVGAHQRQERSAPEHLRDRERHR